jgi:hypothetical protein
MRPRAQGVLKDTAALQKLAPFSVRRHLASALFSFTCLGIENYQVHRLDHRRNYKV